MAELTPSITIAGRRIGAGEPVYIIAEMSANHGQNFEQAIRVIEAAKTAGADAIKIQTYTADTITLDCDNPYFMIRGTLWDQRKLHELYAEAYTPWDWQPRLAEAAADLGMHFFSTPFDDTSVDFLESLSSPVPAYKIASFENTDHGLMKKVVQTGKPIIMSTGLATLGDLEESVQCIRQAGGTQLALLKCTSAYPAPPEEMNLRTIPHLAETFQVPAGLSDHSLTTTVPVAAVALGACIIEKHLSLARSDGGPDAAFSLEPQEFSEMVRSVRIAEKALGLVRYGVTEREQPTRRFKRSLFAVRDIAAGEPFTNANVRSIRPADGLHTRYLEQILGRVASHAIERGTPLSWEYVGDPHPVA